MHSTAGWPNIGGFRLAIFPFGMACNKTKRKAKKVDEAIQLKGYKKWCIEYIDSLPPDVGLLQKEIDEFIEHHDNKVEEEKQQMEMDGIPDEDGWITVSSQGKNKGVPRLETDSKLQDKNKKTKKLKRKKELLNFYSWEQKRSKNEHIQQLQEKMKEDREKIAQMKASRKFKPF